MKEKWLRILKRFAHMPFVPTCIIAIPSFVFVIFTLTNPAFPPIVGYLSYGVSAWALVLTVNYVIRIFKYTEGDMRRLPLVVWFDSTAWGHRFMTDRFFRTEVGLYSGFIVNLAYVVMKLVYGIVYHSFWFIALAAYYLVLAVLHIVLMRRIRDDMREGATARTHRRARLCGFFMLILTPVLATIVYFMVGFDRGYEYPGYLIYVMATYAFYAVTVSIIGLIKTRKYNSPILAADRGVGLTAAMVTMLSLETAMLTQFGSADEVVFRRIIIAVTGAVICVATAVLAIYMIISATRKIKELS